MWDRFIDEVFFDVNTSFKKGGGSRQQEDEEEVSKYFKTKPENQVVKLGKTLHSDII